MKLLITILIILAGIVLALPWPFAPVNQTHKIDGSYGGSNVPWDDVSPTNPFGNFHAGIDLFVTMLFPDEQEVYAVETGYITHMKKLTNPNDENWMVICDTPSSDEGWAYIHVKNPHNYQEGKHIEDISVYLTYVYQGGSGTPHLHFQRSGPEWTMEYGPTGLCNPLDYLDPDLSGEECWIFMPQPSPDEHPWCYFLEDKTIAEWESWGNFEDIYQDTIAADELHGSVDIIQGFWLRTSGDIGAHPRLPEDWAVPHRIEWECVQLGASSSEQSIFKRYLASFDGIVGAMEDWEKYRQFYFRYMWLNDYFPPSHGDMICLTNCGNADDWDGINTIEENYWDTALEAEGSEDSYHPLNMQTPDGLYLIDVTAYAWDTNVTQEVSIDCELRNTREIAQEVCLTDAVTDQDVWYAEWVASYGTDGFVPVKNIYANITAQPGTTLNVEIIFSGPMSTDVDPYVRFTKPDGTYLTAAPSTPEWTSTYLPDGYYDTWHGSVEIPVEEYSGWMTMKIKAKDISNLGLLDPSIANPDPPSDSSDEEYTDNHHGFGIAFSSEEGWPVFLSHRVNGSPALGDLDGDGDLDIAVQSNKGVVQLIDETGLILRTLESGNWDYFNMPLYSSPAVADIDLDGDMDVLAVHPYGCNAWDAETGSSLSGWPVNMGFAIEATGIYPSHSAPTICDLIGDEHPEVVICRHLDLTQPYAVCTVWMYDYMGGNRIWQRQLETGGVSVTSTAAAGDVSSIHSGNEIVVCTSDGYVTNYPLPPDGGRDWNSAVYLLDPSDGSNIWKSSFFNCYFFASPVIGDIDGDGINEIIIGSHLGTQWKKVFVIDGDYGTLEHTFNVSSTVVKSAGIADLNDDGILDIVAVDNTGHVYCWSGEDFSGGSQYDPLPGFPIEVMGNPTSPSIADIDGDFKLEIIVGTEDGYLYAINSDGSICSGYPVTEPGLSSIKGQPVIANLDNDDSLELMFADGNDSYAYCYDLGANSFPAMMPWRQFQHDSWHSGLYEADNTIPEPPTDLTGDIEYSLIGCEVDLDWVLSVNDFYSANPQEPTDVISYQIFRKFPPDDYTLIGRVHAGTVSYFDRFTAPGSSLVVYVVTASDGTNESEYSNSISFPTSPSGVISLGCSVSEEFKDRIEPRSIDELSHEDRTSVRERTSETESAAIGYTILSGGNPGCLTDGSTEVYYSPSQGANAIVIDLGEECTVTSVIPEKISDSSLDESIRTEGFLRAVETARVVEPSLSIEVAGSDRKFYPFTVESLNSIETVRYVRIRGASGLSEVRVYGERESVDVASSVEITHSIEDEGWMIAIPVVEYSEEALVIIYDLSGRIIWSGHAESGSVLHWDGSTGNGTAVPNGVYLLHCSIGSEVSTGSFVVRRN